MCVLLLLHTIIFAVLGGIFFNRYIADTSEITFIFFAIIAVSVLFSVFISFVSAKKLTKAIMQPVNNADTDTITDIPYDEFSPLIYKINARHHETRTQIKNLQKRIDTVNAITENMQEGMLFTDKNGIIVGANKMISHIFFDDTVIGKNILHVYRDVDFFAHVRNALTGTRCEMTFKRNSSIYNVIFSPVWTNNRINGIILLFLDVSEKIRSEKMRKEFSANVSHELKTPLTVISALAEMIEAGVVKPEDIQSFSHKINMQSKRLLTLINDIIRISEFDEKKAEHVFERCNINEIACNVIDTVKPLATAKNISLSLESSDIFTQADKTMLDELMYNLVDNSIKYNIENGSVTMKIFEKNADGTDYIYISVCDTGIGISEKHQQRIFERFYRVDSSRSKQSGGTGLGLAIVKHIAEFHGGTVNIQSTEGKGTTITVSIKKSSAS